MPIRRPPNAEVEDIHYTEIVTRRRVQALLEAGLAGAEIARRRVLVSRPQAAPVGEYLVRRRHVNRTHLKGRLLAAGLKENALKGSSVS